MAVINDMGNTLIINIFLFSFLVIVNVIVFGTSADCSDIGIFFISGFRTGYEEKICLMVIYFIGTDTLFNNTISVCQTFFVINRQRIKAIMQFFLGNLQFRGMTGIHFCECLDILIHSDGRNNDIPQINIFPCTCTCFSLELYRVIFTALIDIIFIVPVFDKLIFGFLKFIFQALIQFCIKIVVFQFKRLVGFMEKFRFILVIIAFFL